jgi:hypothetical protein
MEEDDPNRVMTPEEAMRELQILAEGNTGRHVAPVGAARDIAAGQEGRGRVARKVLVRALAVQGAQAERDLVLERLRRREDRVPRQGACDEREPRGVAVLRLVVLEGAATSFQACSILVRAHVISDRLVPGRQIVVVDDEDEGLTPRVSTPASGAPAPPERRRTKDAQCPSLATSARRPPRQRPRRPCSARHHGPELSLLWHELERDGRDRATLAPTAVLALAPHGCRHSAGLIARVCDRLRSRCSLQTATGRPRCGQGRAPHGGCPARAVTSRRSSPAVPTAGRLPGRCHTRCRAASAAPRHTTRSGGPGRGPGSPRSRRPPCGRRARR